MPGSEQILVQVGIVIKGTTPSSLRYSELFFGARFLDDNSPSLALFFRLFAYALTLLLVISDVTCFKLDAKDVFSSFFNPT
jgi:hypothetical protein